VSPVRAGNEEFVWRRMGLALDAVHNMKERYRIDENRVFIAGASGGGRVASGLGLHFPDVFAGGYYQAGCHWHEALPNPSEPAGVWPAGFGRPEAPRFEKARDESRHVIMAGEKDFNRDHAKAVAEAMAKARFGHVLYQEIPDLGHATAPADAFEKGLLFLLQRKVPGEEPKSGKPKDKKEKEPKK
jgi:predicted esterase